MKLLCTLLWVAALASPGSRIAAGESGGVGELSLDPAALAAWADRALPSRWILPVPGGSTIELLRGAPQRPELTADGLRWRLPVVLIAQGVRIESSLTMLLEPSWDRSDGRLTFRARELYWTSEEQPFALPAAWLDRFPVWEIPRSIDWKLPTGDGEVPVVAWLQGFAIEEQRIVLQFMLGYPGDPRPNPASVP